MIPDIKLVRQKVKERKALEAKNLELRKEQLAKMKDMAIDYFYPMYEKVISECLEKGEVYEGAFHYRTCITFIRQHGFEPEDQEVLDVMVAVLNKIAKEYETCHYCVDTKYKNEFKGTGFYTYYSIRVSF